MALSEDTGGSSEGETPPTTGDTKDPHLELRGTEIKELADRN